MPNCTYCGAWDGDNRDHVVPVSYNQNVYRKKGGRKNVSYKNTVPCCKECNVLLGDRLYFSIPSRAAYLLGTYERRYKKLLKQPDWSEEEIEELGPSMRTSVIQSMKDKNEVRRQLEHLQLVAEEHIEVIVDD
jgi:hypothetical protein